MNLIHEIAPASELDAQVEHWLDAVRRAGPKALAATKGLIAAVGRTPDPAIIEDTAQRIAAIRAGDEGREGVAAFLEKRKPEWLA
jgi:methylglutaconyl-CoA hydratase